MLKRKRYLPIDEYLEALSTPAERKQKREQFYENIRLFYRRKWGCPFRVPAVNGQQLDLFELYETVTGLGGWQKVTTQDRWNEVLQKLNIDENIQMAEHAVRFLYMRFLAKFEQNENGTDIADEHEAELLAGRANRFKGLNFMAAQPAYFTEPPFSTPKATNNGASSSSPTPDFHKLAFALLSGLPNEVAFGLNVLTVLSHPGPFVLNFTHCPQLINMMVALCGVCVDVENPSNLASLYDWWREASEYDMTTFWANAGIMEDKELWPCVYNSEQYKQRNEQNDKSAFEVGQLAFLEDDRLDLSKPVNWRIFSILAILHNLSFEEHNLVPMGESRALIRLLLLCCNCRWQLLRKIAYETLSNIARNINLAVPGTSKCALLATLQRGLHSDDKFAVMRSMEIAGGLCVKAANESSICDFFEEAQVLPRIFTLLSLKDILICVCAMESLLLISDLGRTACEAIARCDHAVDMLVGLLTTDALSFGTAGLSGMKVVEMHGHHARPYVSPAKKNPPPPLKLQPVPPQAIQQQQRHAPTSATPTESRNIQHQQIVATPHQQQHNHQHHTKVYLQSPPPPPVENGLTTPVPLATALAAPSVAGDQRLHHMCEWMVQSPMTYEQDEWSDEEMMEEGTIRLEPCARFFPTASSMLYHVYHDHLLPTVQQNDLDDDFDEDGEQNPEQPVLIQCRWPLCDNTPRALWSLTTHMQDIHCTDSTLEQSTRRRLEMGYHDYVLYLLQQFERSRERREPPATGYSDFAAQEAIRRHAFTNLKREITDDSEGPVTRNIRLTAALILRNVCRHSVTGRRRLRKHESFMSRLSLSRMESGRTLAQCLAELVRHGSGEPQQQASEEAEGPPTMAAAAEAEN